MSNQERNVFTFSVMSFFAQMLITALLVTASAGESLNDSGTAQNLAQGVMNEVENTSSSVSVTQEDVENIRGSTSEGAVIDPITYIFNFGKYLGSMINVISVFGLSYLTLAVYVTMTGPLGWIAGMIIAVWQIATMYFILTFIFERLKR